MKKNKYTLRKHNKKVKKNPIFLESLINKLLIATTLNTVSLNKVIRNAYRLYLFY